MKDGDRDTRQSHKLTTKLTSLFRNTPTASIWSPLDTPKHEIRLLELRPASKLESIVKCRLRTVSLEDNPEYEAISYTWGTPLITTTAMVNGKQWTVSRNLDGALRHLRDAKRPRTFWADALCISQVDLVEKSAQVQLIGRIFRQATVVNVWLGDAESGSGVAMHILSQIRHCESLQHIKFNGKTVSPRDNDALTRLLHREYWQRAWIIQEILLARRTVIYCGAASFDGTELPSAMKMDEFIAQSHDWCDENNEEDAWLNLSRQFHRHFLGILSILEIASGRSQASCAEDWDSPKLDVLVSQKATVDHDHVYAYLYLFDRKVSGKVTVDYTRDVVGLYTEFASAWMSTHQKYDLLSHASTVRSKSNPQLQTLPTWCPDFGDVFGDRISWSSFYVVNPETPQSISVTRESSLQLTAARLDEINAVLRPNPNKLPLTPDNLDQISAFHRSWRKFLGLPGEPDLALKYVRGGLKEHAYWRTMVMDQCWDEQGSQSWYWTPRDMVDACVGWYSATEANPPRSVEKNALKLVETYHNRSVLFQRIYVYTTKQGYFGVANEASPPVVGDLVYLIAQTKVPFILRSVDNLNMDEPAKFQLVGESYVHGMMEIYDRPAKFDRKHVHDMIGKDWNTITLV